MLQQQQQSEERLSDEDNQNQNRLDNQDGAAVLQEGVVELHIGEGQHQELRIAHDGAQHQEDEQSAEEQQQEGDQGLGGEQPLQEEQPQVNDNGLPQEQQEGDGLQLQGGGGQQQEGEQGHEGRDEAQQEAQGQPGLEQEQEANEMEEFLQSVSMCELTECGPEKYENEKDVLLKSDTVQLKRLRLVYCHRDPAWVLSLLQKHAMHLRVLKLYQVRSEHLLATLRMPKLQELTLHSCYDQDPNWKDPTALPLDLPVGAGLRKLTASRVPWSTVVALLTAHRLTLRELKLRNVLADEGSSQELLSVPLLVTLPRLRKITLDPPADYSISEEAKALIHQNHVDLLTAARLSLEELVLSDIRSELLQVAQSMPRLRKLKLQEGVVNNVEGLVLSASEEDAGDVGLRTYEAAYSSWEAQWQVTQKVLVAYSRTLEEVKIRIHVAPDHLLAMQRMPRLRKMYLEHCVDALNDNPIVPVVDDACRNVKTLGAINLPNATVLSLLSLYSESLEELELRNVTGEQLLAVAGLPNLRRLKIDDAEWNSDETTVVVPETQFVRLERLETMSLPKATLLSVLVASRTTLQEVVLGSEVLLEQLLELQRMPALRTLRLHSCHEDLTKEAPALPKQLPVGVTGLRVLEVREMPRQTLFSLLVSHSRTLEELDLEGPAREHLLATLRMPELRRLCLRGSRRDLREVPQLPEVVVGEGVTVLRLSESNSDYLPLLPMETIRCLLTAHRHSIRHLEVDVDDERDEDNRDAADLWPVSWSGLHRVLQQCALERLEVVSLNRCSCSPTLPGGRCREQLAALLRVLPGTEVRCSVCHFRKGNKPLFDRE